MKLEKQSENFGEEEVFGRFCIRDVTENPSGGLLRRPDIRPPESGFCIQGSHATLSSLKGLFNPSLPLLKTLPLSNTALPRSSKKAMLHSLLLSLKGLATFGNVLLRHSIDLGSRSRASAAFSAALSATFIIFPTCHKLHLEPRSMLCLRRTIEKKIIIISGQTL